MTAGNQIVIMLKQDAFANNQEGLTCETSNQDRMHHLQRSTDASEGLKSPTPTPAVVAESPAEEHDSVEIVPTPSPQSTSLILRPRGLRTQRDFDLFHYCSERFIQLLTIPDATYEFRDAAHVFAVGFDEPWVMHAALAPAALHASHAELIPKEDAIVYTQSALEGLRRATERLVASSESRETFLAASLFMGVFEDFYSSLSSSSLTHYRAIGKVLEMKVDGTARLDLSRMSFFERTLLDSVLYHFSTRILYERDIELSCSAFPSVAMAKYIDALEHAPKDNSTRDTILPVLGKIPPAIFLLIYQVTWLSRQHPLDESNQSLAVDCLVELDAFQKRYPALAFSPTDSLVGMRNSDITPKLYALALRIFLAKIIDPDNVSCDSPWIQELSRVGFQLLQSYDGTEPCGQLICWPVVVLGCAACPTTMDEAILESIDGDVLSDSSHMRQKLQEVLLQMWKVSYSGNVRRTASTLRQIWALPTFLIRTPSVDSLPTNQIRYDGLKALISKAGLGPESFSSLS